MINRNSLCGFYAGFMAVCHPIKVAGSKQACCFRQELMNQMLALVAFLALIAFLALMALLLSRVVRQVGQPWT